jgi:hypothetical protein
MNRIGDIKSITNKVIATFRISLVVLILLIPAQLCTTGCSTTETHDSAAALPRGGLATLKIFGSSGFSLHVLIVDGPAGCPRNRTWQSGWFSYEHKLPPGHYTFDFTSPNSFGSYTEQATLEAGKHYGASIETSGVVYGSWSTGNRTTWRGVNIYELKEQSE